MFVVYFKSYSGDEFFLKTEEMTNIRDAKMFCQHYVPEEYDGWEGGNFRYSKFMKFETDGNEPVRIDRSFGEYYLVFPDDITEFDEAYFSDCYCPDTFNSQGENLGGLRKPQ